MLTSYIVIHRGVDCLDSYFVCADFDLKKAVVNENFESEDEWAGERLIAEMLDIEFDPDEPGTTFLINQVSLDDTHLITNHQFNLVSKTKI